MRPRTATPTRHAIRRIGPIGRLGYGVTAHFRWVLAAWLLIALALGAFAPRAEKALSGAGWEATGSQSVQARELIDKNFDGLSGYGLMVVVHSPTLTSGDPAFRVAVQRAERILASSDAVSTVVLPQPGASISPDRHTAVIQAGAARDSNGMVRAAGELKGRLERLGTDAVRVHLTGAAGMWSDFNEANKAAMMRSEVISWPVTITVLVLAFGSLVAAGLPLMLTLLGLMSAAGALYVGSQFLDISIWAMNFALMFALALGIDYALFVVYRFRTLLFGGRMSAADATAVTMDTAGKAVLFSGLTVMVSLSAVMLVPIPAFRSIALGIILAVIFVLVATLTLLPAVLAKLGPRVEKFALKRADSSDYTSARLKRWAERLWRRPLPYGIAAVAAVLVLALPVLGVKTGMPSIKVVPSGDGSRAGYNAVKQAFGPGATGPIQIVAPRRDAAAVTAIIRRDGGIARVMPAQPGGGALALIQAIPSTEPSVKATGRTIDRLRAALPEETVVGGAVVENRDLENALAAKTLLVIGVVLALSFLLFLVALHAPLIAAVGVVTNLLATAAAFGAAKLIFQDGVGHSLLGFESQGFLDAWGPIFFFAMSFAISMDYTVFLLSSAKEHWDHSGGNPRDAMVGAMAHTGRVIFAAGAVMVAVFFTFALSGPLPPKEMGVILGIAVLLDALVVRLLLVPVLLRLLGAWAWYAPRWVDWLLPKVRFGHA